MRHSIRSQIFTGDLHNLLVVGTEGDEGQSHEEVLRIHDAKLAALGTDSLTRAAIDSYRKKHFGTADPLVPGQVKTPPTPPAPVAATTTKPEKRQDDSIPQKVPTAAEQAAAAVARVIKPPVAPVPATSAPPTPEASTSAERSAAPQAAATAPAEDVCEVCGAPVAKSQAKLSQLFQNKTLCKKCMEAP